MELLEASGIGTPAVVRDVGFSTTVKSRIIARNQQVVRVDRERRDPLTAAQAARAMELFNGMVEGVDAVVVADYGKGFLSQSMADCIARAARNRGKILTVDPHPHTSLAWRGATAIKPNRTEAFLAAGMPVSDPVEPALDDAALLGAGKRLLESWEAGSVLITLGEQGMLLLRPGEPPYHTPSRAKEVFDVSGAGDTSIAVFTLALAAGAPPVEAAEMANRAGGIVVGKLGTATVTPAELRAACADL
jgi:D-glycero-beta-D-manno-heptose-7-phosphate kinase